MIWEKMKYLTIYLPQDVMETLEDRIPPQYRFSTEETFPSFLFYTPDKKAIIFVVDKQEII